jgi:hypothetical protein
MILANNFNCRGNTWNKAEFCLLKCKNNSLDRKSPGARGESAEAFDQLTAASTVGAGLAPVMNATASDMV